MTDFILIYKANTLNTRIQVLTRSYKHIGLNVILGQTYNMHFIVKILNVDKLTNFSFNNHKSIIMYFKTNKVFDFVGTIQYNDFRRLPSQAKKILNTARFEIE